MNLSLYFIGVSLCLIKSLKCYDSNDASFGGIRTTRAGPKPPWNETYADKLRNDLLTNYDKYARPGEHYNVTPVWIGIFVTYVEIDELNSTVSIVSTLKLSWDDPKLKWNEEDYGGLENIKMADHEIWQPDIYLYNSASGGEALTGYGNPYTRVYPGGRVVWYLPAKLAALCEFDLFYWPFDTQRCYLEFASWTHSADEMQLKLGDGPFGAMLISPSTLISPWKVDIMGEVIEKYHDTAQYNLTLTRKSSSYVAVVITPVFAIISLVLIQCCLRWHSGERIILSCCTAMAVTILLTYFMQKMPAMGCHTPWIVTFYSTSLYVVAFSIAESIFLIVLLKTEHKKALPWSIKRHLQGRIGKLLLLEHCTSGQNEPAEEMKNYHLSEFDDKISENDTIIKSTAMGIIEREWEVLAVAVDRISFLIYTSIYFILIMYYVI